MKKALKISLYCFVLSCIIALALCYIIIPERTKSAIDVVIEYLNTPLGIVGGTTITLGLVAYIIFKIIVLKRKTSVKEDIERFSKLVATKSQELKEKELELKTKEKEINVLLSNFVERIDTLSETIVHVCETSPNAKIKAIAYELKSKEFEIKQDLSTKQGLVEKYSDKELTEIIDRLVELEKVVKTYGEREERTHD